MKKIIMMLVTISMILSFVACGNSKETGNSETVATDSSAVSEETIAKELEEFGKEFTCMSQLKPVILLQILLISMTNGIYTKQHSFRKLLLK